MEDQGATIFFAVILLIVIVVTLIKKSRKKKKLNASETDLQDKLNDLESNGYTVNKHYFNTDRDLMFGFDENKKEFFAAKKGGNVKFFSFDKIIDCQININGQSLAKSSASNIIGGAIIAGGVGAIIGATMSKTSQKLKYTGLSLTFDDLSFPKLDLCFAKDDNNKCRASQKDLKTWHGVFKVIIERNGKNVKVA